MLQRAEGLKVQQFRDLAEITRRNAEIEIQRMVEMAAKKMADSSVAIPPPPQPLTAAK